MEKVVINLSVEISDEADSVDRFALIVEQAIGRITGCRNARVLAYGKESAGVSGHAEQPTSIQWRY